MDKINSFSYFRNTLSRQATEQVDPHLSIPVTCLAEASHRLCQMAGTGLAARFPLPDRIYRLEAEAQGPEACLKQQTAQFIVHFPEMKPIGTMEPQADPRRSISRISGRIISSGFTRSASS